MKPTEELVALSAAADEARVEAGGVLDDTRRAELGQFLTPAPIARFMASMFDLPLRDLRVLDAGAGVGSLTAALVEAVASRRSRPHSIEATVFEIDLLLLEHLRETVRACKAAATARGISFSCRVRDDDFIRAASSGLDGGLFGEKAHPQFNAAILNPPYRKLNSFSRERVMLRAAGIETSNLYAAFVGLAIKLLEPGGELVAITPRSFCNGPYFRPFRELLLRETALLRVHVFETRNSAFADDDVLQENVIYHARKGAPRGAVVLSSSAGPGGPVASRTVSHDSVVDPSDPNLFIHLAVSEADERIARRMRSLASTLADLGLEVSTGRVVDFRAREHLLAEPGPRTVPLIYPAHFAEGFVAWPRSGGRKPNALSENGATRELMVPSETYVLTKRFTSKEERRRVVAAVYDPTRLPRGISNVGFENHLNYFHARGRGLPKSTAKGLALFLNSSLVDLFFRQFNGHTQVNASDLRSLRYPSVGQLNAMGRRFGRSLGSQGRIDALVDEALAQTRKASAR
jgi:adenine-specific DNA-methyltransferase